MAAARTDPRLAVSLATLAGGALVLLQTGLAHRAGDIDILFIRRVIGDLVIPNELYFEGLARSPYFLLHYAIAGAIKSLGLTSHWGLTLGCLKTALSFLAFPPLHRLLKRLTRDDGAASLGVIFYAMNVTFFTVAASDVLNPSLPHLAVLPAVFWSLDLYLAGRKGWAHAAAAMGLCLHLSPTVYLIPLYFLEDVFEMFQAPRGRGLGPFALRWLCLACFCALFVGWAGGGGQAPPRDAFLAGVRFISPQINLLVAADKSNLTLSIEGLLLLAALGGFKTLAHGDVLRRLSIICLLGCAASTAFERIEPAARLMPLWSVAVRVVWLRSLLFINIFALAAAAARIKAMIEDGRTPFTAATLLCAVLFISRTHDYAARAAALPLAVFFAGPGASPRAAWLWAALAAAWSGNVLWPSLAGRLAPAAMRWLPLRGGIFELPSFHPVLSHILAAAALVAAAGSAAAARGARLGLLFFFSFACLLILRADGYLYFGEMPREWRELTAWIREKTPLESLWVAPLSTDPFVFMSDARRELYFVSEYYDVIFAAPGYSRPIAQRLRAYGVDPSRCRDNREVLEELARAERDLAPERMQAMTAQASSAYAIRPASQPLRGLPEAYRNPGYIVYRLR